MTDATIVDYYSNACSFSTHPGVGWIKSLLVADYKHRLGVDCLADPILSASFESLASRGSSEFYSVHSFFQEQGRDTSIFSSLGSDRSNWVVFGLPSVNMRNIFVAPVLVNRPKSLVAFMTGFVNQEAEPVHFQLGYVL